MHMISAIFNRAINDNLVSTYRCPFKLYMIKTTRTSKRAIGRSKIKKILELKFEPTRFFETEMSDKTKSDHPD